MIAGAQRRSSGRAVSLLGAAFSVAALAGGAAFAQPPRVTAYSNLTVVDVRAGRLLPGSTVIVRGNTIEAMDRSDTVQVPSGAIVVNGKGAFAIPGLWDMHVHTFNNGQAAGTDNHQRSFALQIANGVTGVRDMWTDLDDLRLAKTWRLDTDAGRMIAPRLHGTSPILDGSPRVWPNSTEIRSAQQARDVVDALAAGGAEALKVYTRLSRESFLAITERAKTHNLSVVGHLPQSMRLVEVIEAGQKSVEHLQGLAETCSALERAEGVDDRVAQRQRLIDSHDPALCAELFKLMVRKGTWQVPTLVLHRGRLLAYDPERAADPTLAYISKQERTAWRAAHAQAARNVADDKTLIVSRNNLLAYMLARIGDMQRAGVNILAGTDLGNPWVIAGFSLHDELALFVEGGMTPLEALRTATWNPARYFDATATLGSIEGGKLADFVLLEADPLAAIGNTKKIRAVVTNGQYLDRKALDALLASASR
ncbi:MAG: amidohydrolase family protein [Vicinamibacterales bacterium]